MLGSFFIVELMCFYFFVGSAFEYFFNTNLSCLVFYLAISKPRKIKIKLEIVMSNVIFWRSFLLIFTLSCSGALRAASCEYNVVNEWTSGFTGSIVITNDSDSALNDWSVSWGYSDGSIVTQAWNTVLSGTGPYIATNYSYNGVIAPNDSVTFGFNGTKGVAGTPAEVPVLAGICSNAPLNQRPVASSSASVLEGYIPFDVTFDASNSTDPDNDSLTYLWDFGDGETSTSVVVTKSFSQAGTFSVSLTVNDGQLDSLPVVTTIIANEEPAEPAAYLLNGSDSALHFVSTKNTHIIETHHFDNLSGFISESGVATLVIDLNSVESNIDIRNERMRNILFETGAFPEATVTLPVDVDELSSMAVGTMDTQTIVADVNLHGVASVVTTDVVITKLSNSALLVESVSPLLIQASMFDLVTGIDALKDIANLAVISYTVPVNFTLFFNTP